MEMYIMLNSTNKQVNMEDVCINSKLHQQQVKTKEASHKTMMYTL